MTSKSSPVSSKDISFPLWWDKINIRETESNGVFNPYFILATLGYDKKYDIFYVNSKSHCHDYAVSEITSPYRKDLNDFIYIIATPSKGGRLSRKKVNNMVKLFNDYLSESGNEKMISFEVNPSNSKLLVTLDKSHDISKRILYVLLKCMRFFWCEEENWRSAVEDYFVTRTSPEDSKWVKPNVDNINAVLDFMRTCFETKNRNATDAFLYSIFLRCSQTKS